MNDKNKCMSGFALAFAATIIVLMMVGCSGVSTDRSDRHVIFESVPKNEWISPDGVHYWIYGHQMSPRYDHNGNLVID